MKPSAEHRRALALLAESDRGVVEAVLIEGRGFTLQTVVDLIRLGYAHADVETVRAGARSRRIEVVRVTITDAGRRAMEN